MVCFWQFQRKLRLVSFNEQAFRKMLGMPELGKLALLVMLQRTMADSFYFTGKTGWYAFKPGGPTRGEYQRMIELIVESVDAPHTAPSLTSGR